MVRRQPKRGRKTNAKKDEGRDIVSTFPEVDEKGGFDTKENNTETG